MVLLCHLSEYRAFWASVLRSCCSIYSFSVVETQQGGCLWAWDDVACHAESYPSTGVDTQGLKKGTACVICFERGGDHVFLPCGHGGYCGACAHKLLRQPKRSRVCPICRGDLGSAARVDMNTAIGSAGNVLEASIGGIERSGGSEGGGGGRSPLQGTLDAIGRTPSQTYPPETSRRSDRLRAAAANEARANAALRMAATINGPLTGPEINLPLRGRHFEIVI